MPIARAKRTLIALLPLAALAACSSQNDYAALQAQNAQLQAQNQNLTEQVNRLQGTLRIVVNDDLHQIGILGIVERR